MREKIGVLLLLATTCLSEDIKVNRARSVNISDDEVRAVLQKGSAKLNISGQKCGFYLSLDGNVGLLDEGVTSVSSPKEFDAICDTGAGIHIVDSITSCSTKHFPSTIEGCSKPGCTVVVQDFKGDKRKSLWMHEQGHARCLVHRPGPRVLMDPHLDSEQFEVRSDECQEMISGCPAGISPDDELAEQVGPKEDVKKFVQHRYFHGLPFAQAKLYSPEDVKEVSQWLKKCHDSACKVCEKEQCWPNIVMLLGLAGSPNQESDQMLRTFLQDLPNSSPGTRRARLAVPLALGYLMNRIPAAETDLKNSIRNYLESGTQVQTWEVDQLKTDTNIKTDTHIFDKKSAIELAKQSILGLGVGGKPVADAVLQKLLKCSDPQKPNNQPHDGCDEFLGKISTRNLINYARDLNTRQQQKNAR